MPWPAQQDRGGGTVLVRTVDRLLACATQAGLDRRKMIDLAGFHDVDFTQPDTHAPISRFGEDSELETRLESPLPPILGDPSQFQLALMNLALNARDAMPHGGVLTIVTESASIGRDDPVLPAGEYVVIIVADTGHAMDVSVRHCIFKPFFQAAFKRALRKAGYSVLRRQRVRVFALAPSLAGCASVSHAQAAALDARSR